MCRRRTLRRTWEIKDDRLFFERTEMMQRIRMLAAVGVMAVVAVAVVPAMAKGSWGGRRTRAASSCGCGVAMPAGAAMPGMTMAPSATQTYAPATAAPAAAHSYTCPMHPSVVSVAPGSCPYCHMALTYR